MLFIFYEVIGTFLSISKTSNFLACSDRGISGRLSGSRMDERLAGDPFDYWRSLWTIKGASNVATFS
jgi:hypothetical protein